MKNNIIKANSGFTLIEILIASFIFSIVVTVAIGVFTLSTNTQITTENMRNASQGERFALETLARDVRMADNFIICQDSICNTPSDSGNYLKIFSSITGDKIYGLYNDSEQNDIETLGVQVGSGDWQPIVPNGYVVDENNSTYIFIGYNPISASIQQPYVNIEFHIANFGTGLEKKASERVSEVVRTTVTNRTYKSGVNW